MGNKGPNRGRQDATRTEDGTRKLAKDEAVARDPDIGGVNSRESRDVHMRPDPRDRTERYRG